MKLSLFRTRLMKRAAWRRWASFIMGLALFSGPACSAQLAEKAADLGEQVTLTTGQDVTINGESLKIQFAEVISDSRCPTGAT